MTGDNDGTWIFGYGSLIWRPDFEFLSRNVAWLDGWSRRFWQGSHDHRGTAENPGRVVTLVREPESRCGGMAYLVKRDVVADVFENLDYREKNGYQRFEVRLQLAAQSAPNNQAQMQCGEVDAIVYIAPYDNFAYLGEADIDAISRQILASVGPSGANVDYLFDLARALRDTEIHDAHVFDIEREVKKLLNKERSD